MSKLFQHEKSERTQTEAVAGFIEDLSVACEKLARAQVSAQTVAAVLIHAATTIARSCGQPQSHIPIFCKQIVDAMWDSPLFVTLNIAPKPGVRAS